LIQPISRAPTRWKKLTAIPFNLAAAAVCALLTQAAWTYWQDDMLYQSAETAWLAWLGLILPVAFGLLVLHFLLRAVLAIQEKAA
jgi:TRAP-type C4-dicarboxylate transport system permease small subunit